MNYISINSKRYNIIEQLGEGGFGKVYKVKNDDGKFYALKKISLKDKSPEEKKN